MARDVVDRQVSLLARLVEELLDVSRISQGKIALKKEPVELARIIAHSVETARPLIDARAQTLTVSVPPAPVWLSADFARLSQVVANLLNNAAKYTGEGGRIELAADAERGRGDDQRARQRHRHRGRSCCRRCSTSSCRATARSTAARAAWASASRW